MLIHLRCFQTGLSLICSLWGAAQTVEDSIYLNQVGFQPGAGKEAYVGKSSASDQFFVTSTNLRDTFFSGRLEAPVTSKHSKTVTRRADFSSLTRPGSYVIAVPGLGHSYVFRVAADIYTEPAMAALKAFYFHRVSEPLPYRYAGRWHRSAGHPDTAVLVHPSAASASRPAGTVLSAPGGWYDAGDYNKYIVNSGITMATLLSAWEDFPEAFRKLEVNIPESGNRMPDILDETLYNLRWMLAMQDPADGGVYHKLTNASFDGMLMPGVTRAPRFVVQKTTAATLDFAAVMAQAARVYRPFLPRLADSCLKSAERAWSWAEGHPSVLYRQEDMNKTFQPAVTTGAYGDGQVNDEWLWAAAELWTTAMKPVYLNTLRRRMGDRVSLPSWGSVGMLGYYTLLRKGITLPAGGEGIKKAARDSVEKMARKLLAYRDSSAFGTVMGASRNDYNWGGSSVAANQAILLLQAYRLNGDRKLLAGVQANLDYLLGRNATGYSFVTGVGSKTPMHPHHRPSEADGITEPVPGFLVGGPNIGMQDRCVYPYQEVETAYTDDVCSYASNEVAINWQAPLVYLLGAASGLRL